MPSFTGLIGSVLKGASEPYTEAAMGEMKNQQKMDLEKQLSNVLYERDQRIKESDMMRARTEEERKLSPEYLKKVGTAKLEGSKIDLANREQLAPEAGRVSAIETTAGLPAKDIEAQGATGRKLTETKTLAGDTKFVEGVKKLDIAQKAGEIEAAKERAKLRLEGGGGGGGGPAAGKVRSTYTDDQGNKVAVMSDGNTKILGKAGDFDKNVSGIVTKLQKDDPKIDGVLFSKLPLSRQRELATEILTGQSSGQTRGGGNAPAGGASKDLSGLSKFQR